LVTMEGAEKGGFYRFTSDKITLKGVKETYERLTGKEVGWQQSYTVPQIEGAVMGMRQQAVEQGKVSESWKQWAPFTYGLYMLKRDDNPTRLDSLPTVDFPNVKKTSMEEYIKARPNI